MKKFFCVLGMLCSAAIVACAVSAMLTRTGYDGQAIYDLLMGKGFFKSGYKVLLIGGLGISSLFMFATRCYTECHIVTNNVPAPTPDEVAEALPVVPEVKPETTEPKSKKEEKTSKAPKKTAYVHPLLDDAYAAESSPVPVVSNVTFSEPETKAETKIEPKVELKPESKVEPKVETRVEAKEEIKADTVYATELETVDDVRYFEIDTMKPAKPVEYEGPAVLPNTAWECPACGRKNAAYIGTCACGTSR